MTAHCHITPSWDGVCVAVWGQSWRDHVFMRSLNGSLAHWCDSRSSLCPSQPTPSQSNSYLTQLSAQSHTSTQNRHLLSSGPNLWKKTGRSGNLVTYFYQTDIGQLLEPKVTFSDGVFCPASCPTPPPPFLNSTNNHKQPDSLPKSPMFVLGLRQLICAWSESV